MYNKSIKFARKVRGLDAAQKTRNDTYLKRYTALETPHHIFAQEEQS